jgi:hypothetical protein
MGTTSTRRQPAYYDLEDRDDLYETRMPSSALRYRPYDTMEDVSIPRPVTTTNIAIQRRRASASANIPARHTSGVASRAVKPTRTVDVHTQSLKQPRNHSKRFYTTVIVGMFVTVALLAGLTALVSWWQGVQTDMTYGYPRTFQMDAVVGHNDSAANPTHFVLINLHGHVQIIEIQGGDAANTHVYTGPTLYGADKDRIPVTGKIVDQQGQLNLLVQVGGQNFLYVNNGKTFQLRP